MRTAPALAIELDALGDTRPLWNDWLVSAAPVLGLDVAQLPHDRGEASLVLDDQAAGNWRVLLERFSEDRAGAYLRRDSGVSAALRSLAAADRVIGVFSDAPEPLAKVALVQLGADRRVTALETGEGALDRLRARLAPDAIEIRSRAELLAAASD